MQYNDVYMFAIIIRAIRLKRKVSSLLINFGDEVSFLINIILNTGAVFGNLKNVVLNKQKI